MRFCDVFEDFVPSIGENRWFVFFCGRIYGWWLSEDEAKSALDHLIDEFNRGVIDD